MKAKSWWTLILRSSSMGFFAPNWNQEWSNYFLIGLVEFFKSMWNRSLKGLILVRALTFPVVALVQPDFINNLWVRTMVDPFLLLLIFLVLFSHFHYSHCYHYHWIEIWEFVQELCYYFQSFPWFFVDLFLIIFQVRVVLILLIIQEFRLFPWLIFHSQFCSLLGLYWINFVIFNLKSQNAVDFNMLIQCKRVK